jgi:hypothetical protein
MPATLKPRSRLALRDLKVESFSTAPVQEIRMENTNFDCGSEPNTGPCCTGWEIGCSQECILPSSLTSSIQCCG